MFPWDNKLKAACQDRSGEQFGDPPCYEVLPELGPCEECEAAVYGSPEKNYRCPETPDLFKEPDLHPPKK